MNYQSDFKILEGLKDGTSILSAPFRFTYYVKMDKGVYVAEYDGSEFKNCRPTDDGRVVVPFDHTRLGLGELMVKREFYLTDSDFKDGICNLVSVESTGITLDKGATEGMGEVHNEVLAFYNTIGKEGGGTSLTKVTYAELKEMRDNGSLAAGHLYRITDYEFTTVQKDTKSAGNVFDIIVLAASENQLSELARAIQHEGDTYFDGNDLGAWELWYDLDNDTTKYVWADEENGKGVIYRMIDEKRNDCPYDFKNALFYNTKLTAGTTSDKYYYTFSYVVSGKLYDGTVEKQVRLCYDNSMGVYLVNNTKSLNLNVFINNTFGNYCHSNNLGNNCSHNTFGNYCNSNTFGNNCYSNTFGDSCYSNTFGNNCYSNTFGDSCNYNTFGNFCYSNTFGDSCGHNTFGYYCNYNTFGDSCSYNTFGYSCNYNTFGNNCNYNTFGNNCKYNTFKDVVSNRELNSENTSITLNDEYYDDGSGQLVPIKHPNLSTQPSILPYKFMGQYVYEQLIPNNKGGVADIPLSSFLVPDPLIIEATSIYNVVKIGYSDDAGPSISCQGDYISIQTKGIVESENVEYFRIVYTSMPEEGDYYGYNNY